MFCSCLLSFPFSWCDKHNDWGNDVNDENNPAQTIRPIISYERASRVPGREMVSLILNGVLENFKADYHAEGRNKVQHGCKSLEHVPHLLHSINCKHISKESKYQWDACKGCLGTAKVKDFVINFRIMIHFTRFREEFQSATFGWLNVRDSVIPEELLADPPQSWVMSQLIGMSQVVEPAARDGQPHPMISANGYEQKEYSKNRGTDSCIANPSLEDHVFHHLGPEGCKEATDASDH